MQLTRFQYFFSLSYLIRFEPRLYSSFCFEEQNKITLLKNVLHCFQDDSDHDVDLSNVEIDPDEPTYCLCDQVIY